MAVQVIAGRDPLSNVPAPPPPPPFSLLKRQALPPGMNLRDAFQGELMAFVQLKNETPEQNVKACAALAQKAWTSSPRPPIRRKQLATKVNRIEGPEQPSTPANQPPPAVLAAAPTTTAFTPTNVHFQHCNCSGGPKKETSSTSKKVLKSVAGFLNPLSWVPATVKETAKIGLGVMVWGAIYQSDPGHKVMTRGVLPAVQAVGSRLTVWMGLDVPQPIQMVAGYWGYQQAKQVLREPKQALVYTLIAGAVLQDEGARTVASWALSPTVLKTMGVMAALDYASFVAIENRFVPKAVSDSVLATLGKAGQTGSALASRVKVWYKNFTV